MPISFYSFCDASETPKDRTKTDKIWPTYNKLLQYLFGLLNFNMDMGVWGVNKKITNSFLLLLAQKACMPIKIFHIHFSFLSCKSVVKKSFFDPFLLHSWHLKWSSFSNTQMTITAVLLIALWPTEQMWKWIDKRNSVLIQYINIFCRCYAY